MTDRELLELAAKAAGYEYSAQGGYIVVDGIPGNWNPLYDDGDALRLAVKLGVTVSFWDSLEVVAAYVSGDGEPATQETCSQGKSVATRRAIVRAAAEIGKMNSG